MANLDFNPNFANTNLSLQGGLAFGGVGLANPSAQVDGLSTTQGWLPPRMTTTQRDAISSPATGLLIYNTTTSTYNYFDGAVWLVIFTVGGQQKSRFYPVLGAGSRGDYNITNVGSNGSVRLTGQVPDDFATLVSAGVFVIPAATASGLDIDLNVDFATVGEAFNLNSAADTASTFSFTVDQIFSLSLTSLFSGIAANDLFGVFVNHNAIGQSPDYLGVGLVYST